MSYVKRFLMRSLDKEPMVVVACVMGVVGVSFASIAPAVRKSMGYQTFQWHGVEQDELMAEKAKTAEFVRGTLGQAPALRH